MEDEKLKVLIDDILDKLEKAQEAINACYKKLQELGVVTERKAAREEETHGRLVLKDIMTDDPVNRILAIRNLARLHQLPIEPATALYDTLATQELPAFFVKLLASGCKIRHSGPVNHQQSQHFADEPF